MKNFDINSELEKAKTARKNGGYNLTCTVCGESHPRTIELHHISGRGYSNDLVPLCANCHRKVTDPKDNKKPPADPPALEQIGMWLLGLVSLLYLLVEQFRAFGEMLLAAAQVCPQPYGYGGSN